MTSDEVAEALCDEGQKNESTYNPPNSTTEDKKTMNAFCKVQLRQCNGCSAMDAVDFLMDVSFAFFA